MLEDLCNGLQKNRSLYFRYKIKQFSVFPLKPDVMEERRKIKRTVKLEAKSLLAHSY